MSCMHALIQCNFPSLQASSHLSRLTNNSIHIYIYTPLLFPFVISYFQNFRHGACRVSSGIHDITKHGKKQWKPRKHRWNLWKDHQKNQWTPWKKSINTMETWMKTMDTLDETHGNIRWKPCKHSMKTGKSMNIMEQTMKNTKKRLAPWNKWLKIMEQSMNSMEIIWWTPGSYSGKLDKTNEKHGETNENHGTIDGARWNNQWKPRKKNRWTPMKNEGRQPLDPKKHSTKTRETNDQMNQMNSESIPRVVPFVSQEYDVNDTGLQMTSDDLRWLHAE